MEKYLGWWKRIWSEPYYLLWNSRFSCDRQAFLSYAQISWSCSHCRSLRFLSRKCSFGRWLCRPQCALSFKLQNRKQKHSFQYRWDELYLPFKIRKRHSQRGWKGIQSCLDWCRQRKWWPGSPCFWKYDSGWCFYLGEIPWWHPASETVTGDYGQSVSAWTQHLWHYRQRCNYQKHNLA